jgi:hypothetical protein
MEEGGQPGVISGSDSAELDKLWIYKFQRQKYRALHQIQCASLSTSISVETGTWTLAVQINGKKRAL